MRRALGVGLAGAPRRRRDVGRRGLGRCRHRAQRRHRPGRRAARLRRRGRVMTGRSRVALHGGIATLAASSALLAVFDGLGWFPPVFLAVAIVVVAGELIRRSPLPAALSPLLAAFGVLCLLTAMDASENAFLNVLPTRTS